RRYWPMDYNASTDDTFEYTPPAAPVVNPFSLTPQWQFPGTAARADTPAVDSFQGFPLFSASAYNNAIPRETHTAGPPTGARSHPAPHPTRRGRPGGRGGSQKRRGGQTPW